MTGFEAEAAAMHPWLVLNLAELRLLPPFVTLFATAMKRETS